MNVVITILGSQLDTPMKREPKMKICLHQTGLWACCEALFDWKLMEEDLAHCGRRHPLKGSAGLYKKARLSKPRKASQ